MAHSITIPPPVAPSKTVYIAAGGDMGTRPANGGYPHLTGALLDFYLTKYEGFPRWISPLGDEVYSWGHLEHWYTDRFGIPWVYGGNSGGLTLQDKRKGDVHKHFLPVVGNHEGYDDLRGPDGSTNWTASNPYEPEYFGYDSFWTTGATHPRTGVVYQGMGFSKAELNIPSTPGQTRRRWYAKDLVANDGIAYWKFLALNSDKTPDPSNDPAQFAFIEEMIADARNTSSPAHPGVVQHIIAGFHHPTIVSVSGGSNTQGSRAFWEYLQDYSDGIVIFLGGHVHVYQRFHPIRLTSGGMGNPNTSQPASVIEGIIQIVPGAAGDNAIGQAQTTYVPSSGAGAHSDHLAGYGPTANYYGVSVLQLEPHRAIHEFVPVDDPGPRGAYRDPPVTYVDPRRPIPDDDDPPPPPPPGAPVISSITPANLPAGSTVTIIGSGFNTVPPSGGIVWGTGFVATYSIISSTEIACTIPPTIPAGQRKVVVTGSGGSSNQVNYIVGASSETLNAVAVATFPEAIYKDETLVRRRARLQGPRGGPYVCKVRIDASASTYPVGTTFEAIWGDATTSPAQASPVLTHEYVWRHQSNWGMGAGRKDIIVTLRAPNGQSASVTVPVFILPDHALWGIWQDNDSLSYAQQQTNVGRAIDAAKRTHAIIPAEGNNLLNLPPNDSVNLSNNTFDVGPRHCVIYLDTHFCSQKPNGDFAAANWTWRNIILNRTPKAATIGGRSWPASSETPKEYIQRQVRQLYEWGGPIIWCYHQEPENDVAANQTAWDILYPSEPHTFDQTTYCQFWDTIDEWIRTTVQADGTVGLPNLIGSYMGNIGGTVRVGGNGGHDSWLQMTRQPDIIGMSYYNNGPTHPNNPPWRDFNVGGIEQLLTEIRQRGTPFMLGEFGCGPDPNQANRKANWFRDALAILAGRQALPSGKTVTNTEFVGLCWNSGNPPSFVDYRWSGSGVPSAVTQAVLEVFADDYTDWGFLANAEPPPVGAPIISSFTPLAAGAGATITISGEGFTNTSSVQFGTKEAASFNVVSDTTLQATVPAGAPDGRITVTTPGGSFTSAQTFDYLAPPEVRGTLRLRA